ncbi:hypothetical protein FRC08_016147 [Ceratobasidium sp. 394]|nr:hypothetical protein FRC08_016147 [Ceratobasidium sp. 394]
MGKSKQKRPLNNAADLSISRAPAPPKKQKAVKLEAPRTVTKTRFATKASGANDAGNQVDNETPSVEPVEPVEPVKPVKPVKPVEPDDSAATPPPTKGKKAKAAQQPTAAVQDASEAEVDPAPTPAPPPAQAQAKKKAKQPAPPKEPVAKVSIPKSNKDEVPAPLSPPESRKSSRPKMPSKIAAKVNVQAAAKQNVKDTQAAKKAKKAEAAVIVETPEETAAFLSRVKGNSQPAPTSRRNLTPA